MSRPAVGQELEPRSYAPSPVGITFLGAGVGRSSGDLLFEPTIPVTDGRGTVNSAVLSVGRIVGVWGRPIVVAANRWSFKPEVGVSVPWRRWDFDFCVSSLFFSATGDYNPGERRRTQSPVVAVQGHATYTFRPRLWVAGNATWYRGGRMSIDGGAPYNLLQGARFGATLALPVSTNQSVKLAYSTGMWTRSGGDFETLVVGWQIAWADRPRP